MKSKSARTLPPDRTLLASEFRSVLGALVRRLRQESNLGDLTASQSAVLGRLERDGPATVTTLAKAEGVRPQSMGATVAVLEEAGLILGSPDPSDKRQTILSLTDKCRAWVKLSRAAKEDWLARSIERHLTKEEQVELSRTIGMLQRLLEP